MKCNGHLHLAHGTLGFQLHSSLIQICQSLSVVPVWPAAAMCINSESVYKYTHKYLFTFPQGLYLSHQLKKLLLGDSDEQEHQLKSNIRQVNKNFVTNKNMEYYFGIRFKSGY